jgi:hypothetical protein
VLRSNTSVCNFCFIFTIFRIHQESTSGPQAWNQVTPSLNFYLIEYFLFVNEAIPFDFDQRHYVLLALTLLLVRSMKYVHGKLDNFVVEIVFICFHHTFYNL